MGLSQSRLRQCKSAINTFKINIFLKVLSYCKQSSKCYATFKYLKHKGLHFNKDKVLSDNFSAAWRNVSLKLYFLLCVIPSLTFCEKFGGNFSPLVRMFEHLWLKTSFEGASSNLLCIVGRLMLFRLLVLTLAKDLHLMERNILSILLFPSSETVRKITNCFIQKKKNVLKKRFVFLNFVFYKRQSSLFVYLFKKADI